MRESLPKLYESSDETIQAAQDNSDEDAESEPRLRTRSSRGRKLGSKAVDASQVNPEVLRAAYDIVRQAPDGRVDYGRISRGNDGSVTVYNSRAQRAEFEAKQAGLRRRRV